jgi:hypothetical protein
VKDLKKDDDVLVAGGKTAKLECLVQINQTSASKLVNLKDGLRITPNHPIRVDEKWTLPKNIEGSSEEITSDELYCFVLEPRVPALVNGVECATWGHGLE